MNKVFLSLVCLAVSSIASAADGDRFALMDKAASVEQCHAYAHVIENAGPQSGDFQVLRHIEMRKALKHCEVVVAQRDTLQKSAALVSK